MQLRYDPTISFSTILSLAVFITTAVGGWYAFRLWMTVQLTEMRSTLNAHAKGLEDTTAELALHRAAHQQLLAQVQILVGQMSMLMGMQERRQ